MHKKIIGLVPGAMKPFHRGHYFLISMALKECDEVIVYTSTKDRLPIQGSKMKQAWENIICPRLPPNVKVNFVKSPIGSVFLYLYDDAQNGIQYRIYGGTEDLQRFETQAMNKRYPNLDIVNTAQECPENYDRANNPAKGEWVRNTILAGDHQKFREYLPDILKNSSKKYFKILTK